MHRILERVPDPDLLKLLPGVQFAAGWQTIGIERSHLLFLLLEEAHDDSVW